MDSDDVVIFGLIACLIFSLIFLMGGMYMSERMYNDTIRVCVESGKNWDDGDCK